MSSRTLLTIVIGNVADGTIRLYSQDGHLLRQISSDFGNGGGQLVAGDVNGDGIQEIVATSVIANAQGRDTFVYGQNGEFLFSQTLNITSGDALALTDLNNDGRDDYLVGGDVSFDVDVFISLESGHGLDSGSFEFEETDGYTQGDGFAGGNVAGDTFGELVIIGDGSGRAEIYDGIGGTVNRPIPRFNTRPDDGFGFRTGDAFTLGNFDGEGRDEFVYGHTTGDRLGRIDVHEPGSAFVSIPMLSILVSFTANDGLAAGDLDDNGIDELVVASDQFNNIEVYSAQGSRLSAFNAVFDPGDSIIALDGSDFEFNVPDNTEQIFVPVYGQKLVKRGLGTLDFFDPVFVEEQIFVGQGEVNFLDDVTASEVISESGVATFVDITGIGTLDFLAGIEEGTGDDVTYVYGGGTHVSSGNEVTAGDVLSAATGLLMLTGDGPAVEGRVVVNGVMIGDDAVVFDNYTFSGHGRFTGSLLFESTRAGTNPRLSPGSGSASALFPEHTGTLTVGSLTLSETTTYQLDINGVEAGQYDQVVITNGDVDLAGATLQLNAPGDNLTPSTYSTIKIIDVQGTGKVNGTFANFPDGSVIETGFGGRNLVAVINYSGGDGNDVTIEFSPFRVVSTLPPLNSHDHTGPLVANFNLDVDPSTVTNATAVVHAVHSGLITQGAGNVLSISGKQVTVTAAMPLHAGELVQATFTSGIHSVSGEAAPGQVLTYREGTSDGTGRFTNGGALGTLSDEGRRTEDVQVADLDGDGDLDVMTVGNELTRTYINLGNGVFEIRQSFEIPGLNLESLILGDLDNDGDVDGILVADSSQLGMQQLRNDGSGIFTMVPLIPNLTSIQDVALGDVDADGDLDLLIPGAAAFGGSGAPVASQIWLNSGTGSFTPSESLQRVTGSGPTFPLVSTVDLIDVDRDGDLDAILGDLYTGGGEVVGHQIWLNDGHGHFVDSEVTLTTQHSQQFRATAWGDLDGDGDLDLFVSKMASDVSDSHAEVWRNDSTSAGIQFSLITELILTVRDDERFIQEFEDIELGDLDGDGDLDAVMSGDQLVTRVFINDGHGSFQPHVQDFFEIDQFDQVIGHLGIALADLDGNGALDALTVGYTPSDGALSEVEGLLLWRNEPQALTLQFDETSISENGGIATGTVLRNSDPTHSLTIILASSDIGELSVPMSVVIPAGAVSATFTVFAVDDPFDDGDNLITVTASATGLASGTGGITVADNDHSVAGDDVIFFDETSRTFRLGSNTQNGFDWFQTGALPNPPDGLGSFIGDFDGDGDLDAAVRNRTTNIVNLYTNNGDGTLTGPQGRGTMATAGESGFFQVGDYDGNGRDEILWLYLSGQYAGQVFTKDLTSTLTFNMVKANPDYDAFITGDFNGDGFDDLLGLFDNVAGTKTNMIPFYSIASNNPNIPRRLRHLANNTFVQGSFGRSVVNDGLTDFRSADLNGDGKDDIIAVTTSGAAPGQVLHATTTGSTGGDGVLFQSVQSFQSSARAPRYSPTSFSSSVLLGRFNDDLLADTVSISNGGSFFVGVASLNSAFLNPVVLSSPAQTYGMGIAGVHYVVGDFNGDGYDDLLGLGVNASLFFSSGSGNEFGSALDFGPIIGGGAGQIGAIRTGSQTVK